MSGEIEVKLMAETSQVHQALDSVIAKAKQARDACVGADTDTGLMGKVFWFFGGRHTFFALVFTVSLVCLTAAGKVSGQSFVAGLSIVQTLVLGHSIKEDFFKKKDGDEQ